MILFSSKDWSQTEEDAYLYAIAVGWDDDGSDDSAMSEIADRFRWDEEKVAFLRQLHSEYQQLTAIKMV